MLGRLSFGTLGDGICQVTTSKALHPRQTVEDCWKCRPRFVAQLVESSLEHRVLCLALYEWFGPASWATSVAQLVESSLEHRVLCLALYEWFSPASWPFSLSFCRWIWNSVQSSSHERWTTKTSSSQNSQRYVLCMCYEGEQHTCEKERGGGGGGKTFSITSPTCSPRI